MATEFKREPLTPVETDRLVNACKTQREKLIVWTLLGTGLREEELAHLKVDNIQWQQGSIVVFGKGRDGKKKRRVVFMREDVKTLLRNHFALNEGIGFEVSTIYRAVKRVANRAGISKPVSPHVLRHTFAIDSLQRGVSVRALQAILGHADLRTTMFYLNMSNEEALDEFRRKLG
jgi:integrase/recombinase XerD